jgi:hypothetical protein
MHDVDEFIEWTLQSVDMDYSIVYEILMGQEKEFSYLPSDNDRG